MFLHASHSSYTNAVTDSTSEAGSKPSNVIPFESQELVSLDVSDDDAINMLFMLHENIILKDGKGITQEVSYLGLQFQMRFFSTKFKTKMGMNFLLMALFYLP